MACSLSNTYGATEHRRNVSVSHPVLPNAETFYPAQVCWTTLTSPGYLPASECNQQPGALSCTKTPSKSVVRRQEMFRSGRLAAYASLQKAGFTDTRFSVTGFSDPIANSGGNTNDHVDSISHAHRICVVGKNPDRSPCWPTGFVGSISHSDRWVVAVAARSSDYQSLGVDSEIMVAERLAKDLQPNIGTPSEWKLLDEARIRLTSAFTLLFSAKESFYKCWYPLKRKFMDHLDVEACDIKPDRGDIDRNANYGVIALRPRTGHAYDDNREVDAMQLSIRYCFTSHDVFTIATLPH